MCPQNEEDGTQGRGIDPNIPCDPQQAKYGQRDFSLREEAVRTQGVGKCQPWEREQKGKVTYLSDYVVVDARQYAEYLTCLFGLYIPQHNTFRHYYPHVEDESAGGSEAEIPPQVWL